MACGRSSPCRRWLIMRGLFHYWWLFAELGLSVAVHFTYAMTIVSTVLLGDAIQLCCSSFRRRIRASRVVALQPEDESEEETHMFLANKGSPQESSATTHHGTFLDGHEKAPIVLVHGIFGFGKGKLGNISYWAGAEEKDERVLVPDLGSLTSIHDRARELFYYLKGGIVDYGFEHSQHYGHSQFGKNYGQGHYPEWDESHPIHFVGHSTGAQVIRVLQQMLADKQFEGYNESTADWVLSLTSLSGALNGTTRVYIDGLNLDGKTMKTVSLLQLLKIAVLVYEWLDIPVFKKYYGFGFEHFTLPWHKIGLRGLVKCLAGHSGPFATGDWILPDLSIQSAVGINSNLGTHRNTFYFSYATKRTTKLLGRIVPSRLLDIHPLLMIRSLQISCWKHPLPDIPYEGYRDEDWQDNDGALNTISMLYPRFPYSHKNCPLAPDFKDGQALQPGVWYFTILEADHIYFIVNRDRAGIHFDVLYDSIFRRCRKELKRSWSSIRRSR
ncbi:uncharacterized protein LOC9655290 [Selaginella moellendorffii]|uniref:uncharacterized protein LOC9655290 n=1 Tax=Selaginella moellendorffii TaxID=88036 RepID=UPI000D1C6F51|nr:uncharacterized protein LOC9655290 [Selaginella moellendorffii]|eukprot:XP_024524255.1 uncharacterized protein LOC9655290 [Selaginella moellendorffii]